MLVKRVESDGTLHLTQLGTMYPGNFGLGPVAVLGDNETLCGVLTHGSEHTTKESPKIWETKPGDVPAVYQGPLTPVDECAAAILAAIEGPGFEHYVPASLPNGLEQKALVMGKTSDVDTFLSSMSELARSS